MCFKWLSEWEMFGRRVRQTKGSECIRFYRSVCTHLTSLFEASPVQPWEDDKETRGRVLTGRRARSLARAPPSPPSGGIMARDIGATWTTDGACPAPEGRLWWQRASSGETE